MPDAIILAGGRAARLGGRDKTMLRVGGVTLLDLAVGAVRGPGAVVVVGPARELRAPRPVSWAREDPPLGGPVAALAAGLAALPPAGSPEAGHHVLLLAADLPHASDLVDALLRESPPADRGRVVVDVTGRAQWTAGLYPRAALEQALGALPTPAGASLHALLSPVAWDAVAVPATATLDVDTPADAAVAGAVGVEEPRPAPDGTSQEDPMTERDQLIERWWAELVAALDLPSTPATPTAVLDLAATAAHEVVRPAAPLTTFLVGYAAGLAGGSADAVAAAISRAEQLAHEHDRSGEGAEQG